VGHNLVVASTPSFELVGRDEEFAQMCDVIARIRGGPGAVVVRGDPGIGKTVLWREAVAAAQRDGIRVLVSRCAEAEMPIPLGAVSDLLDPAFEEVASVLAEPQRRALAAALGIATHPHVRPDRLALPRALVAAFRALAAEAPVLVAVDDMQWLDTASARVLAFAARRVGDAPIGVLATLRGGQEDREPLGLADAFEPGAFTEIVLGPLSMSALQHVVRLRFDFPIPRPKLAAVHAASGGNPMFALEFARAAEREEADLRALPVPSSLQELVRERIRALPASTRPLLELVAVIERPTHSLLAKALGGATAAETLIDEAVSAGAISVAGDDIVRFTHPLLGSAVYFDMSSTRRLALHREAAGLVNNVEQQARHLALATTQPDNAIADIVERAAAAAAERGAPDAAAALAAEAVRLTPPDDELARVRRTFIGAGFLIVAGDVRAAQARVEPLLDPGVPAAVRSQALMFRAEAEHEDRTLLRAFLREAIEIAPDPRVRCQAWIRYAQHGGWVSGDARTAAESAREALRVAVELGDRPLIAASTAALAYYEAGRGRREVEFDEAELVGAELLPRMAPWQITPAISVGTRLLWAGELDRARDVLHREYEELVRQGSMLKLPLVLMPALVDLEWRAGRWAAAEAHAEEARAILEDALPGAAHVVDYARLLVAGSLGRVDEARRLAAEALRFSELRDDHLNPPRVRWALGHVELARGDAAAAWQALEGMPEALEAFGIAEPGWQPVLPDVVEALVTLGRLDEADAVLRQLEEQAVALRHRWAAPAALRCRALLLLAGERADEAAEVAERAAARFEERGFPLDRARALLAAGAARRRAGQRRRAADTLARAIEILTALGAPLWLERAEDELRRASPRPRRDRELTTAERRVAALVAEGQTNREVAAQLFTTIATVEAHLTRIYRKLGVRSRTQLARAVADGMVVLED
jgi:DNA-binding CsgD family transcriptional regulator